MIVAVIICILLSAICDSIMDTLAHHYAVSRFKKLNPYYWNPDISWLSKYIDRDPAKGQVKWNFFIFSITKHVAFTDAWHFFKSLKLVLWCVAIGILTQWYWVIILGVGRNYVFSFYYDYVLLDKARRRNKRQEFFPNIWFKIKNVYICITNVFKK